MIKLILKWSIGLVALVALGCGEGDGNAVDTAPVSGTVYLDDKPLAGAEINFFCEVGNFLGTGITDAQGKYQLYQGGAIGTNKVWVTTKKNSGINPVDDDVDMAEHPELDPEQQTAMGASDKKAAEGDDEKLPKKFSDADKTVLTFNVPKNGANNADFRLTSN